MRTILVLPHNPAWGQAYRDEAARLLAIFAPRVLRIHHMGSTAIPGIKAKPIVDLCVEVDDIQSIDAYNQRMISLGYIPKGEYGIPGRRLFIKGEEEVRTHNIHIYQAGNPEISRHLDFRDFLRTHPLEAQAYSLLKEELARKYPHDITSYTEGKTDFIRDIEQKARVEKTRS